jgi:hypothetical protein
MFSLCFRWMLTIVGAALLLMAALPWVTMFRLSEPYATEWISAKLLMLPVGAICLLGATALSSRVRH